MSEETVSGANRRSMIVVSYLGMLTFGIVLTTLGALLPSLVQRFGIDKAGAGALFTILSAGILAGSLVFGPIVDRRGYKGMLLLAIALIVVGLEGIAFAPSLGWLRIAIGCIAFGGGIVNGGTNALVADVSSEGRGAGLSLLGVFFGIGAVGVPFALALLLDSAPYTTLIAALGALVMIPLVVTAAARFPEPKQAQGFPLADAGRLLRDPVLLLMGAMLFLQSGMEITVGGWTSTYFEEELGVSGERALAFLSLFWFGMMTARLALGSLLRRMDAGRVLLSCLALALVGAALLLGPRGLAAAAVGVYLLGAGLSATFPVLLGFVGDRYTQLSGTAFSVVIVMALTGGMVLPFTTGALGARYGLRGSFLVIPAALVVLGMLLVAVSRRLSVRRQTA
jgi:FHS family glucose/mannose:H+ symporter-like MFS transporter